MNDYDRDERKRALGREAQARVPAPGRVSSAEMHGEPGRRVNNGIPGKNALTDELLPAEETPSVPNSRSVLQGVPWSGSPAQHEPIYRASAFGTGIHTHAQGTHASGGVRGNTRVAGASSEQRINAVIKILVYRGDEVIQQHSMKSIWEGPLPIKYAATRVGGVWRWDDAHGKTIRVNVDRTGHGGQAVEAWAKRSADKMIIYAQSLGGVTLEEEADEDTHAPGHVDKEDAGDGSSDDYNPNKGHGTGGKHSDSSHGDAGAKGSNDGKAGGKQGNDGHDGTPDGDDFDFGSSAEDEKLADEFERALGIDHEESEDATTTGNTHGGKKEGGEGEAGGDPDGRTGEDTRKGGTGTGGPKAKPDGKEEGIEDAHGNEGSKDGSKDGAKGGDPDGMYAGKGKAGDKGVAGTVALFGGLIGVPASLRGAIELGLLIADGDITGAGAGLFKEAFKHGIAKYTAAHLARKMIAREARIAAAKETKAAIKVIEANKATAAAWKAATKAERDQVKRRIYWELQRKFFDGYLKAAKQAEREAKALLKRAPKNAAAQARVEAAQLAQEAATVKPVAGRLPINHEYAGKRFPDKLLPPKYRQKGLQFTKEGYPDFSPHAKQLPNGKNYVAIEYTGARKADFAAANKAAGLDETPPGWTWHHVEDMNTMYLVPTDLHDAVKHSGGVSTYKHATGVDAYGS